MNEDMTARNYTANPYVNPGPRREERGTNPYVLCLINAKTYNARPSITIDIDAPLKSMRPPGALNRTEGRLGVGVQRFNDRYKVSR